MRTAKNRPPIRQKFGVLNSKVNFADSESPRFQGTIDDNRSIFEDKHHDMPVRFGAKNTVSARDRADPALVRPED
jgi:hypothetical protein